MSLRDRVRRLRATVRDRSPTDTALGGVLVATALALLVRLWGLGTRTAHVDEARVGVAIVEYLGTGAWEYQPILHGPFLFHVNRALFAVAGPTDFSARLVVALVGGLLPLSAWLFRRHLRAVEVVAFAGLLAANPVLLYYSRFMRNDVLVGAFMLVALGFGVRTIDTQKPRYLYAGAAFVGLALTTKENALVYLGTWVGAALLVADHFLVVGRVGRDDRRFDGVSRPRATDLLAEWGPHVGIAAAETVLIAAVFYAPRPALWQAIGQPWTLPGVFEEAVVGSWTAFWGTWVAGGHQNHPYIPYFVDYLGVLLAGALVVLGYGVGGFLANRYVQRPRCLVQFAGFWGLATIVLSPLVADISPIPWMAVHAVIPLAIPAAVGLAVVYRQATTAIRSGDRLGGSLWALLLVIAAVHVGTTAVGTSYLHPQDPGQLVQYGQPDDDLAPPLREIRPVVAANDGTDVVFYGDHFGNRVFRMPFPWYLSAMGADVDATSDPRAIERAQAPVVIAPGSDSAGIDRTERHLAPYLDGYTRLGSYAIVLEIPNNEVYAAVYVRDTRERAGTVEAWSGIEEDDGGVGTHVRPVRERRHRSRAAR